MRTSAARLWPGALLLALAFLAPRPAAPEEGGYRTPPQALVDILDAPPTPLVLADPRRQWLLVMDLPSMPPVAELAERELRLAGLRIRPRVSGPSRSFYVTSAKLQRIADGSVRAITGLPAEARLENGRWSPDGSHSLLHPHRPRWHRAVGGGGGDRSGAAARRRAAQPGDRRRPRLARRRQRARRRAGAERPRHGAAGARGAGRPGGAGEHGHDGRGPHLPGPPEEPVRRGALRPLRDLAARPHRGRQRGHPARRAAGRLEPRPVAGRPVPARRDDPSPLLLPRPRLPLPAAHRGARTSRAGRCGWSPTCRSRRRCRSPSAASPPGRATSSGVPTSRRRWSGPRRSTAATPAARPRSATASCGSPRRSPASRSRSRRWRCATRAPCGGGRSGARLRVLVEDAQAPHLDGPSRRRSRSCSSTARSRTATATRAIRR